MSCAKQLNSWLLSQSLRDLTFANDLSSTKEDNVGGKVSTLGNTLDEFKFT